MSNFLSRMEIDNQVHVLFATNGMHENLARHEHPKGKLHIIYEK